jgi:hypothetical protein
MAEMEEAGILLIVQLRSGAASRRQQMKDGRGTSDYFLRGVLTI